MFDSARNVLILRTCHGSETIWSDYSSSDSVSEGRSTHLCITTVCASLHSCSSFVMLFYAWRAASKITLIPYSLSLNQAIFWPYSGLYRATVYNLFLYQQLIWPKWYFPRHVVSGGVIKTKRKENMHNKYTIISGGFELWLEYSTSLSTYHQSYMT